MAEHKPLYRWSFNEAVRLGETDHWRASHTENIACREYITQTINLHYDGACLGGDVAEHCIAKFGYDRVNWLLANTIRLKEDDGRFSAENKEWAKGFFFEHDDSYNMGSIMFLDGVDSDEMLGEFALENGMIEEYNNLPDAIYEALDKTKAGARMREWEGGVIVNGGYLLVNEDFSGEPLPAEEPLAYFQVRFSDGQRDSGWCDLPLSESDERLVARVFGCEDLSGLPLENRSSR